MADSTQTFKILLQVVSQLGGLQQLTTGVQGAVRQFEGINAQLASMARGVNAALGAVGIGLGIQQLNELGNKSLEVREKQAAFTRQILASRDGSQALVNELNELNEAIERNAGVTAGTSRYIEQQLALYGATGDQLRRLTPLVVDFAKARGLEPQQVGFMLSRAIAGEDLALGRLGLHLDKEKSHAEQINQLIEQLGKTAGTGAAIAAASGGMTQFEVSTEHARIALGNFVNLVRVPFLTSFTSSLEGASKSTNGLAKEYGGLGQAIFVVSGIVGDAIGGMVGRGKLLFAELYRDAQVVGGDIGQFILGIVGKVVDGIARMVKNAIDGLNQLAHIGAAIQNITSLGIAPVDTKKIDEGAEATKKIVDGLASSVKSGLGDASKYVSDQTAEAMKAHAAVIDEMQKRGGSLLNPEGIEQLKAKYKSFIDSITAAGKGVTPGSGVIENLDPGKSHATAEATAALSNAKLRLTEAELSYKNALEETKLLEDSGLISHDEATRRNLAATREYIAELDRIKAALPSLISQFENMGVKGVAGANELKAMLQQVINKGLEAKIALQGQTFFGQVLSQTRQLANEWGNLGKQIGGFLTQQFQNFASGASQAITGLIFRTQNWRQAILQIGQSFVQSLIQMVIQWVLSRTIMSALNKAFGAADQAAATAQAAAAAAAWAPAATAASIASYGTAAATGLAAYVAALASGTAATVGASAGGGLAEGGRVPGPASHVDNVMLPMATGEAVISSRNVQRFDAALGRGFVDSLIVGKLPGFAGGGRVSDSAPLEQFLASFSGDQKIGVHVYFDPDEVRRRVLNDTGKKIVVDAIRGKRLEIG
jgi:hypothetical protein